MPPLRAPTSAPDAPAVSARDEWSQRPRRPPAWRRRIRPAVLLVLGGVAIYLLLPSLLAVFGSWRTLAHLDWPFAVLVLVAEAAASVCVWELDRIALHTRAWFPVATAQLAGNAAGRVLPGGGATATAVAAAMLRRAGVDTGRAVAGFGVSTALQIGTTLALPVLALPAILGGAPINHSLAAAAYLGVAAELLRERDFIRETLGRRWKAALASGAGSTAFDYVALLAALRAVGANPQPSLVLLAYTSAELLALVPVTPGGLGFVEAGLVGTLTLAGVPGRDALAATLLYRIVAYWLPLPAGGIAYVLFRHRYEAPADRAGAVRT